MSEASLTNRWTDRLMQLRKVGRWRKLAAPCGIDFSSNDYLGYGSERRRAGDSPLGLSRSGLASRLLRGHHPIWDEVETGLARWQGRQAALVFSSGYAANEGLLSTIIEPQDWVASDRLNHASIIDGLHLSRAEKFIFRHNDLGHLEEGLKRAAQTRSVDRELFIVTESIFGMDGDLAPLGPLSQLAARFDAHLIVDEAHATGCAQPGGQGMVVQTLAHTATDRVVATMHTGGKALAVPGAFVCGSQLLRELLINRCRHFIFTTALPAVIGAWWQQTLERVQQDGHRRQRLWQNTHLFRRLLRDRHIPCLGETQIVPIVLGDDQRAVAVAGQLQQRGFDVRAIRPPTVPPKTARLRISIHADHSRKDLVALADALAELLEAAEKQEKPRIALTDPS